MEQTTTEQPKSVLASIEANPTLEMSASTGEYVSQLPSGVPNNIEDAMKADFAQNDVLPDSPATNLVALLDTNNKQHEYEVSNENFEAITKQRDDDFKALLNSLRSGGKDVKKDAIEDIKDAVKKESNTFEDNYLANDVEKLKQSGERLKSLGKVQEQEVKIPKVFTSHPIPEIQAKYGTVFNARTEYISDLLLSKKVTSLDQAFKLADKKFPNLDIEVTKDLEKLGTSYLTQYLEILQSKIGRKDVPGGNVYIESAVQLSAATGLDSSVANSIMQSVLNAQWKGNIDKPIETRGFTKLNKEQLQKAQKEVIYGVIGTSIFFPMMGTFFRTLGASQVIGMGASQATKFVGTETLKTGLKEGAYFYGMEKGAEVGAKLGEKVDLKGEGGFIGGFAGIAFTQFLMGMSKKGLTSYLTKLNKLDPVLYGQLDKFVLGITGKEFRGTAFERLQKQFTDFKVNIKQKTILNPEAPTQMLTNTNSGLINEATKFALKFNEPQVIDNIYKGLDAVLSLPKEFRQSGSVALVESMEKALGQGMPETMVKYYGSSLLDDVTNLSTKIQRNIEKYNRATSPVQKAKYGDSVNKLYNKLATVMGEDFPKLVLGQTDNKKFIEDLQSVALKTEEGVLKPSKEQLELAHTAVAEQYNHSVSSIAKEVPKFENFLKDRFGVTNPYEEDLATLLHNGYETTTYGNSVVLNRLTSDLSAAGETVSYELRNGTLSLSNIPVQWSPTNLKKTLGVTPVFRFGDLYKPLIADYRYLVGVAKAATRDMMQGWEFIQGGLNKEAKESFNTILIEQSKLGEKFKITEGGYKSTRGDFYPASESVMEAVENWSIMAKKLFADINAASNVKLNKNGWKHVTDTDIIVKEAKSGIKGTGFRLRDGSAVELTPENIKALREGGEKIYEYTKQDGTSGFKIIDDGFTGFQDIPKNFRTLKEEAGWAPIAPKGDTYLVKISRDGEGRIVPTYLGVTTGEVSAKNIIKKWNDKALAEQSGDQYISISKFDSHTEFAHSPNMPFANMNWKDLENLKKHLLAQGIDKDAVDTVIQTASTLRPSGSPGFTKERGNVRLEQFDYVEGEVINSGYVPQELDRTARKYFFDTANFSALASYKEDIIKRFTETYGDFLTNKQNWTSQLRSEAFDGPQAALASEAKAVQKQLMENFGIEYQNIFSDIKTLIAQNASKRIKTGKVEGIDRLVNIGLDTAINAMKGKLGLEALSNVASLGYFWGNLASAFIQTASLANTVGRRIFHPTQLALASKDFVEYAGSVLIGANNEIRTFVQNSGVLSTTQLQMLDSSIISSAGLSRNLYTKVISAGMSPMMFMESMAQLSAALIEKRVLDKAISSGKSSILKDTPEYYAKVLEEARKTAIEVSKTNSPWLLKAQGGIMGMTTAKFWQYPFHQAAMFFDPRLTKLEKFGILGTNVAVFGAAGAPLLGDFINLIEEGYSAVSKDPTSIGKVDREYFKFSQEVAKQLGGDPKEYYRLLKEGAVSSLTDGKVNIGERVGIYRFFSQWTGNASIDSMIGGAGYSWWKTWFKSIAQGKQFVQMLKEQSDSRELNPSELLNQAASAMPATSVSNLLRSGSALLDSEGRIRNNNYQTTVENASLSEILFNAAGIKSSTAANVQEQRRRMDKVQKAWGDWVKGRVKTLAKLAKQTPLEYEKQLEADIQLVQEFHPRLLNSFMARIGKEATFMGLSPANVLLMKKFTDFIGTDMGKIEMEIFENITNPSQELK